MSLRGSARTAVAICSVTELIIFAENGKTDSHAQNFVSHSECKFDGVGECRPAGDFHPLLPNCKKASGWYCSG